MNVGDGKRAATASMELRIARLAQVSIDDLLAASFPRASRLFALRSCAGDV